MERHKIKVAVYLMLTKEDKILLTRRFNTGWQDGNYGLPSGHLDPGETIVGALMRETKEEIDILINPQDVEIIHIMHRMNIYIDFFFVVKKWEGELQNVELNKCDDIKWFSLNQLPNNIVPSVKHAIEQYEKRVLFSEFENEG